MDQLSDPTANRPLLLRIGYEICFDLPAPTPILAMLQVHPSVRAGLVGSDEMHTVPWIPISRYEDGFGNLVTRLKAPQGPLCLSASALFQDSGLPDPAHFSANAAPVDELPNEVLQFLLSSRYCEVDRLGAVALDLFGGVPTGWGRVQAVCDWVHARVSFDYRQTRQTKSALDVYTERVGVCRDYQHLAITFCRALNIPARYATGYLGDIEVPARPPMDFSAWFEAFLDGKWWTFDARNNIPRKGRILMAVGRDAADVAMTTSFGVANLTGFTVVTEIAEDQPAVIASV